MSLCHLLKIIFLLSVVIQCNAQTEMLKQLLNFQDKIQGLDTLRIEETEENFRAHRDSVKKFLNLFKEIRNNELEKSILKGKINFGLNGNQASSNDLFGDNNFSQYNIIGGLSLSRGDYPSQLQLSTQLNVSVVNGKLTENLSNINISYDRHFSEEAELALESYSFINRRTDRFLGVDQRYEVGGGLIVAHWSKKLPDDEIKRKVVNLESDFYSFKAQDSLIECINACLVNKDENLDIRRKVDKEDLNRVTSARKRLKNSLIKKHSPLRVGILLGFFIETENTSFSDSIFVKQNETVFRTIDFEPTVRLRWEVRPTIDLGINENAFRIKIRPYLKFPMPWNWNRTVNGTNKFDFRLDFPTTVEIRVKDNFILSFGHTIFYDNAPSSTILINLIDDNGNPVPIVLNKLSQFSVFQVNFIIN